MLDEKELREMYFEWIKDETNNKYLTEKTSGVRLALNMLVELDPFEYNTVVSESIGGHLTQTFAVDSRGIPTKILSWLKPYYLACGLIDYE